MLQMTGGQPFPRADLVRLLTHMLLQYFALWSLEVHVRNAGVCLYLAVSLLVPNGWYTPLALVRALFVC